MYAVNILVDLAQASYSGQPLVARIQCLSRARYLLVPALFRGQDARPPEAPFDSVQRGVQIVDLRVAFQVRVSCDDKVQVLPGFGYRRRTGPVHVGRHPGNLDPRPGGLTPEP